MLFTSVFKPVARWLILFGMLGIAEWGGANPASIQERGKPVARSMVVLDDQELQWMASHPRVVVTALEYPLYLFKDEQGQWTGLNSDLLKRISEMTGLQFVYQESFSTDQMLAHLENGAADLSTTLAMNDERNAFLDFSHAFGGAGWVFVGRAGAPPVQTLEDMAKRVLVLPTRHALEAVIRRDYPAIELRSVKTHAEARAWVESDEAYVTIENEIGARLFPSGRLQVGAVVPGKWDADYLTLRKGQPQLLSILNKALEAFSEQELRGLRLKWFGGATVPQAPDLWQRIDQWVCWGVLVVGLFGLLSLLWNRRLAVVVRQRVEAQSNLRDQLAFQHALMDAMPDPMFVRDLQGCLIMCNKSYEDALSTRFDRMQGRQLIEVDAMPRQTAELLHAEYMAQLSSRRTRFFERQLMFKDGVRDIYQWTVPFYTADGQLRGLLGGWADIARRTRQA
ncbi:MULTISPECIES: transporter substrate-binding domain-containing protein [Pseudomonas]|uniref:Transporter substrate-binding domain-containing protein n=1 Tax=Pseudomonas monachiensis TaxID=3060212 RepID=A0ABW9H7Y4_9PSED|nr:MULTISPECIES: transporter substrate-binding domain-containing protein [unclassified Pseudomonas]KRA94222.1 histidine kinase [Pseudomonas sp. Root68]KRB65816.1 histidine kinase [Pseudomonas sp. Root71]